MKFQLRVQIEPDWEEANLPIIGDSYHCNADHCSYPVNGWPKRSPGENHEANRFEKDDIAKPPHSR